LELRKSCRVSHLLVTLEVMYATSCISTMKLLELVSMLSEVPMRVNSWSTTLQQIGQKLEYYIKTHLPHTCSRTCMCSIRHEDVRIAEMMRLRKERKATPHLQDAWHLMEASFAGTKLPICAMTTISATCRRYVLFPAGHRETRCQLRSSQQLAKLGIDHCLHGTMVDAKLCQLMSI
jgi:hypothetical protein